MIISLVTFFLKVVALKPLRQALKYVASFLTFKNNVADWKTCGFFFNCLYSCWVNWFWTDTTLPSWQNTSANQKIWSWWWTCCEIKAPTFSLKHSTCSRWASMSGRGGRLSLFLIKVSFKVGKRKPRKLRQRLVFTVTSSIWECLNWKSFYHSASDFCLPSFRWDLKQHHFGLGWG